MEGVINLPYPYYNYQSQFYPQPMPDQLAQLRQNQFSPIQTPQPFQVQQNPQSPSIVWVQSENEALNYLVAPNSAVTLWDSNSPVVYLKQADASGKPSMKIYDLVERNSKPVQNPVIPTTEYATKEELAALSARLDAALIAKETIKQSNKKVIAKEDVE